MFCGGTGFSESSFIVLLVQIQIASVVEDGLPTEHLSRSSGPKPQLAPKQIRVEFYLFTVTRSSKWLSPSATQTPHPSAETKASHYLLTGTEPTNHRPPHTFMLMLVGVGQALPRYRELLAAHRVRGSS